MTSLKLLFKHSLSVRHFVTAMMEQFIHCSSSLYQPQAVGGGAGRGPASRQEASMSQLQPAWDRNTEDPAPHDYSHLACG